MAVDGGVLEGYIRSFGGWRVGGAPSMRLIWRQTSAVSKVAVEILPEIWGKARVDGRVKATVGVVDGCRGGRM
jgi:hypothetical protein